MNLQSLTAMGVTYHWRDDESKGKSNQCLWHLRHCLRTLDLLSTFVVPHSFSTTIYQLKKEGEIGYQEMRENGNYVVWMTLVMNFIISLNVYILEKKDQCMYQDLFTYSQPSISCYLIEHIRLSHLRNESTIINSHGSYLSLARRWV